MPNWCDPCPTCPNASTHRAIAGDGPQPARILAIGERPGRDENKYGRVFCGPTGHEGDELYFPLAGLDRYECRLCNTVLCGASNNKKPDKKLARSCAAFHLRDEIDRTNPEFIILMGATACSLVDGIRLEMHHGIPQHTDKVGDLLGWKGWLVPFYHPSIGLHESRWMTILLEDWRTLGCMLADGPFKGDPVPEKVSYDNCDIEHYVDNLHSCIDISIDTESHDGKPWSIQISNEAGTGVLVRCDDKEQMEFLRWWINICSADCTFHNASYDLEVLRQLGIHPQRYRDTMQEAFHLGNLPQGLKPLVYRLFRHTMTSYEETVRPASIIALQEWMLAALPVAQADLSFTERVQLKTKVKTVVHKGEFESLLNRLMSHTDVNSDYNPWRDPKSKESNRLDDFWQEPTNEWMIPIIESRVGHYPLLGIANCKMADAIAYAVGDADWTGRVATELERRRGEAYKIYAGDRDPYYAQT